jgi:PAS domain S-box-containing protein
MSSRDKARSSTPNFLIGGGELGALMRGQDWLPSPLGAPETWPQALRSALLICLNTPIVSAVHWGTNLLTFYNDAYAPALAERHPWAVGRPLREVWAEIWDVLGPQIASVLETGRGFSTERQLLKMERGGTVQDTYWIYSFAPLYDEGVVAGVFVTALDTTDKVAAEHRGAADTERLRRMFDQAPGFMTMLRGPEHVFELTNVAYMQLIGHRDVLGRSVRDALPEVEGQGFFELLDNVYTSGEPFVGRAMPVELQRTPDAPVERRFVDLVYQPITGPDAKVTGIFVEGSDVTEQVIAATELRESEERNRRIVEGVKDHAIFTVDAKGRILDWTPGAQALFGWAAEEIRGENADLLFTPEDQAAGVQSRELAVARAEGCANGERWHVCRDGSRFFANSSVRPLHDAEAQVTGFIKIARDETERRSADAAVNETEQRYRLAAKATNDAIWDWDISTDHILWNEAVQALFGYQPEDVGASGAWWKEHIHPDDRGRVVNGIQAVIDGASDHWSDEYRFLRANGSYAETFDRGHVLRDEHGRATRMIGAMLDLTERKRAEERLRELNADLEKQVIERTLARGRTWQVSPDLLGVANRDGYFKIINPAWTRTLGWTEEEISKTPFLTLVHPDDVPPTLSAFEALIGGQPVLMFENRYRHKDGSYRSLSWVSVPEGDEFYCSARDITAEKEQARALALAQEALRQSQKMEAIGQLTGGVAHDFNNLLTVIRGSADLLRRHELSEEKRRRYVDAISDTADRAAKLTGQLLAFARRQALQAEVFDAAARVNGIADMLRTLLGSRVELAIDATCSDCFVEADASQLETALVNVVVNARDAMDGEGRVTIRIRSANPAAQGHPVACGMFVALTVTDTGCGIPEENLERIFEPFFTSKSVGNGTGLGLSQVFGFARQSGGDIDVSSKVGEGTTFTIYLPRADAALAAIPTQKVDERIDGHGRVLVVEDNTQVGEFAAQLLQELGYDTELATNADEAIRMLESNTASFDVVFSDVVMPGTNGVELGRRVRERWPGLPVVLTSGYSHVLADDARHGFPLLHKPYSVEGLSRILRKAVACGPDFEPLAS